MTKQEADVLKKLIDKMVDVVDPDEDRGQVDIVVDMLFRLLPRHREELISKLGDRGLRNGDKLYHRWSRFVVALAVDSALECDLLNAAGSDRVLNGVYEAIDDGAENGYAPHLMLRAAKRTHRALSDLLEYANAVTRMPKVMKVSCSRCTYEACCPPEKLIGTRWRTDGTAAVCARCGDRLDPEAWSLLFPVGCNPKEQLAKLSSE